MLLDDDVHPMGASRMVPPGLVAPCGDDGWLLGLGCPRVFSPLCHWVAIVHDAWGGGFQGTRLTAGSGAGGLPEWWAPWLIGPSSKNPEQVPVLRAPGQLAEGLPVSHDALLILSQGLETFVQAEVTTSLHFLILAPD